MNRYPLAIDGFGPAEIAAAISVLQSGRYTMGEQVREFERMFADYIHANYAVMVNSGSSANLLMLDAMLERNGGFLSPGDGVLVPALAWSTTVAPVIQLGLRPVFCDVDPEMLEMILPAQTDAKAIMPVHVLGRACNMSRIVSYAKASKMALIEDCCESFGAEWDQRHVGTFGRMGSFSLFFSHHLTTMEGGMIVTDSLATANTLRALRAHGWIRDRADASIWIGDHPKLDPRFLFSNLGYNVRPLEIQGAIGKCRIARAGEIVALRRANAMRIAAMLDGHPELEMVGMTDDPKQHSWMAVVLRCKHRPATTVRRWLEDLGVETRAVIAGNLLRHPAFEGLGRADDFPGADRVWTQCLMIGCYPNATEAQFADLDNAFQFIRKEIA